ncbi:TetR family transcriptional regulator [Maritimibacter alkaliphilus HTCC2654]|uniref:Transcriptional regulator, TetR family protein n=1 Tax=Maritimibacter alkaliphilus HTCC2654 TaxID=314271 RepID=A3VK38_9RHOB|nr:TetR family transcriptional regulator [Maritimibacter alkaliphilus]EAQ11343.1 transcriptional regulator, TetR family protein [Rhodobacterales bacterium HTCC2654] [Maritimibacter alkaliphilus HTCC2654]TYP80049.1 TetR family transcriptional regulator [Maritimibacter alkaliphilus HTCC2654]
MPALQDIDAKRQRAPSQRALATRKRVFDAAERVFADRGFDGATIRDIAAEAGEPVGTIHHHGGGKEVLFHRTVARRAEPLSQARRAALETLKRDGTVTAETLLAAFFRPIFDLSRDDPRWRDYARLVSFVSADERWRSISAACFDPTAELFLTELLALRPTAHRAEVAEAFVFSVSAMLALLTSQGRIAALGGEMRAADAQIDHLIRFCAAGLAPA